MAESIKDLESQLERARQEVRELEVQLGIEPSRIDTQILFKATLEEMHEGLQILSYEWRYVFLNLAAAAQGKQSRQELIGKRIMERYPGFESTDAYLVMNEVMTERVPRQMENFFEYPDGTTGWFELSIEPHPMGILVRSVDITKRKALESQYMHAQKMEAIGLLAGGIAHDFNNKLGIMLLFCEMAAEDLTAAQEQTRDYLKNIQTAIQESTALTRQLLAFGRKQILDMRVTSLNEIVDSKRDSLKRLLGERIDIRFHFEKDLGHVRVDSSQMDQVLLNLCINARDAMSGAGILTIETGNADLDKSYCQLHPEVIPGEYVMISVSDNGCGMEAAVRDRIFEPFFTTKDKGKGTGLGLSSVHGVINQSRGHIWVYSEPGMGSTFKIYLPRVRDAKESACVRDTGKAAEGGTETILLVEDDQLLREAFCKTLQSAGYTVLSAGDTDEAQELFETNKHKIQLLLTDLVLPKLKGSELAVKFRAVNPDLKVIFVSGYTENSIVHNGVLDTESILLQKPLKATHLLATLRRVLDGEFVKGVF